MDRGLDSRAILPFALLVILVGSNVVAIRMGAGELDPFWGASARFAIAALIFGCAAKLWKIALPRGTQLAGASVYGLVGIAAYFALVYWGLEEVRAGFAAVILSLTPLLTLILAHAQGLEGFRSRAFLGACLASTGVIMIFEEQLSQQVSAWATFSIVLAAVCGAEASIIVKRLPPIHPVAMNTVAMAVAAPLLFIVSVATGEAQIIPGEVDTLLSFAYITTAGTLGVFVLVLVVLRSWPASAVSYQFVLAPVVSLPLAALLLSEALSLVFAVGAGMVLVGVYFGVFAADHGRAVRPNAAKP